MVRARRRRARRARAVAAPPRRAVAPSGLARVRLLYLYPSEVHDPLVATMLELPTVVPYFDLSLQHAAPGLLRRMKRWGSGERFLADDRRRSAPQQPDAAFRSSFIVGFPGETEARPRGAARVPRRRPSSTGPGSSRSPKKTAPPRSTMDGKVDAALDARAAARVRRGAGSDHRPRRATRWSGDDGRRARRRRATTTGSSAAPTARRPRSTVSSASWGRWTHGRARPFACA